MKRYSIEELCQLLEFNRRTIRYYIQQGLVDAPLGQKRGAYYTDDHLRQLQQIREWQKGGYSLERIRELMQNNASPANTLLPMQAKRGDVAVWSHIHIAPGVELQINPERAGLSPEQLRELYREIGGVIDKLTKADE